MVVGVSYVGFTCRLAEPKFLFVTLEMRLACCSGAYCPQRSAEAGLPPTPSKLNASTGMSCVSVFEGFYLTSGVLTIVISISLSLVIRFISSIISIISICIRSIVLLILLLLLLLLFMTATLKNMF